MVESGKEVRGLGNDRCYRECSDGEENGVDIVEEGKEGKSGLGKR